MRDTDRVRIADRFEPLFQYVCRLNRTARKGLPLDAVQVRAGVQGLLADIRARAEQDRDGREQFEKLRLPMIYFVDSMVTRVVPNWRSLAEDERMMGGDQRFFEHMDQALAEPGDLADERLVAYYTCLGLGFTGMYANNKDHIKRKMAELFARVRHLTEADMTSRMCPDAYESTDTRMLTQPAGRSLMALVIVFIGMVAVLLGVQFYAYHSYSREFREVVSSISDGGAARDASTDSQ